MNPVKKNGGAMSTAIMAVAAAAIVAVGYFWPEIKGFVESKKA